MYRVALPLALAALVAAPAMAQDPTDSETPDGTQTAPIEIVMGIVDAAPVCEPAEFRLPVDNAVVLILNNGADQSLDFSASDLFAASDVTSRSGGPATMAEGDDLLRVPANGQVEIGLTVSEQGSYSFECILPGENMQVFTGSIEAVPTPGDG